MADIYSKFIPWFLLPIIAVVAIASSGCGKRGSVSSGFGLAAAKPASAGLSEDGFVLVPAGGLGEESFYISIESAGESEKSVSIFYRGGAGIPYALFDLYYDAFAFSPSAVEFGALFGPDAITAGITTKPGIVGLAAVPKAYAGKPPVKSAGLIATVRFSIGAYKSASANMPPGAVFAERERPVLTGTGGGEGDTKFAGLSWREVLVGDGDLSGDVGIADVTPIALHYGSALPVHEFADYDASGEVGISDVTAVALNYLNSIKGYKIFRGDSPELDFETAILDGVSTRESAMNSGLFDDGGFRVHEYSFLTPMEDGEPYYFFAVPYGGDPEEDGVNAASHPLFVTGGGALAGDRIAGFSVRVTGDGGFNKAFAGSIPQGETGIAEFIANGSYKFDLTRVEVEKWNAEAAAHEPAVSVAPSSDDWNPGWESAITWQRIGASSAEFAFGSASGSGVIGICGPDDPFEFHVRATLAGVVCEIAVSVASDPNAPEMVSVHPSSIEIIDVANTTVQLFCNLNDSGGTMPREMRLVAQDGGDDQVLSLVPSISNPDHLSPGQFYAGVPALPLPGIQHAVYFKPFAQAGDFRIRLKNSKGRASNIASPEPDGITFGVLPISVAEINLRVHPVYMGDKLARLHITPDNPKVQLYPMEMNFAETSRYRRYARQIGLEFVPYRRSENSPPERHDAPWARVYSQNPFKPGLIDPEANPLGFDLGVPFIASTALPETGGQVAHISDWGIRDFTRLMLDVESDAIFPPNNPGNPSDKYFVAVFQTPADWNLKIPVGKAEFRKVPPAQTATEPPQIHGLANALSAWSGGQEWPRVRYPTSNGVFFDMPEAMVIDGTLLIIASPLSPDAFHNFSPTVPFDAHRGNSIKFYRDSSGAEFLMRVVPNEQPFSEARISVARNSHFPTAAVPTLNPGGYVPPEQPPFGDPGVFWDDADAGWMIFPLTEFAIHDVFTGDGFLSRAYIALGAWDASASGADRWIDGDVFYAPITVQMEHGH